MSFLVQARLGFPKFVKTLCPKAFTKCRKFGLLLALPVLLLAAAPVFAQKNVTTAHYDNARTGQMTNETVLTPTNVHNLGGTNADTFGKLFSYPVDGRIYAQPLYVQSVTMGSGTPQAGTVHNVVYIVTEHDSVYAFDADSNGGANASPLWQVTLLDNAHGVPSGVTATTVPNGDVSTGDIVPEIGITGTPVIDLSTNTIYVVGKTKENNNYIQRLHALDITTGLEKLSGPVTLAGQVSGSGNGSSGGVLNFDPKWENNRPGSLLLNGILYLGFAAHGDNGPWHGWILAYNAATLQQTSVWCSTSNGLGSGIWMSGAGLAADTFNSGNAPGGRLFVATGNGAFNATTKPYTNSMSYGDDLVRLDTNNGVMTVGDHFTPLNQSDLNARDADVASGGVLLLPDQAAGGHTHLMMQVGKEGRIYIVDRDNLGGFNSASDNIVQEVPVNNASQTNQTYKMNGLWSMPAYWNGNIYVWGNGDHLKAFSFANGLLGNLDASNLPNPTSVSNESSGFPGATPVVSSNGTSNGIVWDITDDAYNSNGQSVLYAHDATNVATLLYSSATNGTRDNPGIATKFVVPVVTNGKVYVGTANFLSIYGLLNGSQQAATPVITPGTESFVGSISVSITDTTTGASIYYTTDGSTPTTASTLYTGAITVNTTETIKAIASANGFLQSAIATATYTLQTQTLAPTFSPAAGSFNAAQNVTLSDATSGAKIYYTTNGTTPTTSSTLYTGPISVTNTTTINAIAAAANLTNSPVVTATYSIVAGGTGVDFSNGFSSALSAMTFNGSTGLADTRLQLTNGQLNQAGTAWVNTPVTITNFTNDFTFQLENAGADGITFTIQNTGLTALGPLGGGLGYGPVAPGGTGGIGKSIAIKFDTYNNNGEGDNSTGLYQNGASPTTPFIALAGTTGIDLHSGDTFAVHMTYDGTTLKMTITDGVTNASFTTSWTVNIPQIVGANTAFVGFTGGTGGLTSSQKIETWTYLSAPVAQPPATAPTFGLAAGTYLGTQTVTLADSTTGATILYTTDGSTPATTAGGSTRAYSGAITITGTTTINALATASGFTPSPVASATYTIQQQAAAPVFSPAGGTFSSAQSVTITSPTTGAIIYYTTNNTTPTTSSTQYTGAITVSTNTTIQAIAVASGFFNSNVSTAAYTINPTVAVNFASGFTTTGLAFNGVAGINGTRLRVTDGGANEAASAWFTTPMNVQKFTNDFTFQLTNPNGDGFAFVIQNTGTTAVGPSGGGLGYGPDNTTNPSGSTNTPIAKSVAIKFDLYSNAGEGTNSTGLYVNGASPTMPATTLGGNVNLHSGDIFAVHMTYDGTTLTMTITDTVNTAQTFTTSWIVNIPSTVGGNTAYIGFTGGTGGSTATQQIITWTYNNNVTVTKTPVVYQTTSLTAASSGPTFRTFAYGNFPDGSGTILDATKVGDNVTYTVNVATAGTYDVKVSVKKFSTRGIWQLTVNGTGLGAVQDEYTAADAYAVFDLGNFTFSTAGSYSFKFTVTGKNTASSGYTMAFDDFTLTPQ